MQGDLDEWWGWRSKAGEVGQGAVEKDLNVNQEVGILLSGSRKPTQIFWQGSDYSQVCEITRAVV